MTSTGTDYFRESYLEALRSAESLSTSLPRLRPDYGPEEIQAIDQETKDRLDAFSLRFIRLQDAMGRNLFRALLGAELEDTADLTQLDLLHRMEKRGIVTGVDDWALLRRLRNLLTHEYPDDPAKQADILNEAIRSAPLLLDTLRAVGRYARERLGMSDLPETTLTLPSP
ncbi:hypothetical protein B1C78_17245 [Thioalkalivibrio denitrificans]|uniref:Nucleotidyltransferase n=1 Tax=Thioalkalivibrio denitrificans TaxID=108003 RepID=A0A1V3N6F5_9GAMM|nr:hypothetical protein [Thioalkalivibrio denitrificans]OOG20581.1 hypothetical protein B1C78_17245 [Thioalkalivibrio denitrificans]